MGCVKLEEEGHTKGGLLSLVSCARTHPYLEQHFVPAWMKVSEWNMHTQHAHAHAHTHAHTHARTHKEARTRKTGQGRAQHKQAAHARQEGAHARTHKSETAGKRAFASVGWFIARASRKAPRIVTHTPARQCPLCLFHITVWVDRSGGMGRAGRRANGSPSYMVQTAHTTKTAEKMVGLARHALQQHAPGQLAPPAAGPHSSARTTTRHSRAAKATLNTLGERIWRSVRIGLWRLVLHFLGGVGYILAVSRHVSGPKSRFQGPPTRDWLHFGQMPPITVVLLLAVVSMVKRACSRGRWVGWSSSRFKAAWKRVE